MSVKNCPKLWKFSKKLVSTEAGVLGFQFMASQWEVQVPSSNMLVTSAVDEVFWDPVGSDAIPGG